MAACIDRRRSWTAFERLESLARDRLMHGLSPQQFAETVSAFLVPFYIALAAMNGVAAYYLWQKTEPVTYFRFKVGSVQVSITNALVWAVVACVFVILAAMCAGANLELMPRMPMALRTTVNEHTGPVIYSRGHDGAAGGGVFVSRLLREAGGGLDDVELDAGVAGAVDDRSEFRRDRHQARQRADRGAGVSAGVFHLAGDGQGGGERRPQGRRLAADREAGRREGAGLAGPGLHRTDLHDRDDGAA